MTMTHNIEELRERFGHLLDVLCEDFNLGDYIDGSCAEDIECNWEGLSDAMDHHGIWTSCGATKFVIGDEDCDYVIKFCPISEDYDYCAREVEVYEEAARAGYADKFAWCAKLFDYDFNEYVTLPIYVMEWCKCDYDMISDEVDDWDYTNYCKSKHIEKSDDALREYYNKARYEKRCSERMFAWANEHWAMTTEQVVQFRRFMYAMFINDIHPGNWGWCDNRLVLVDYSGYGENHECRSLDY